ncbi:MAG: hypothetical protein WDN04_15395 [Rhodospirillales bacterium]
MAGTRWEWVRCRRPNVRGLVIFSAAFAHRGCGGAAGGDDGSLIEAAGRLGSTTTLPSLWLYGENDSLFQPSVWRPMHEAYARAGGRAELVDIGRFMDDSHQMLSHPESIPIWVPRLDAFLARIGMPSRAVFPTYMPLPVPPATHFAAVDDVAAVPWIGDAGRKQYEHFLTLGLPRAFLVAPGGQSAAADGGFDPLGRAYALCRNAHLACTPYAVDRDVVWVPPALAPRPAASHFAAIGDVDAVPWVNDKGRTAYTHFLTVALPRAFVIGTGGESLAAQGGSNPLARAMAICVSAGIVCHPYAVDNEVVWAAPPPPAPPRASGFARPADVAAVPWVNAQGAGDLRALPDNKAAARLCDSARRAERCHTGAGYDPMARALALCRSHGFECRPYAVDDVVVWVPPR